MNLFRCFWMGTEVAQLAVCLLNHVSMLSLLFPNLVWALQNGGGVLFYTIAQSICTHYSCFENMCRFVTLKKNWVQNMECKKQGTKSRVIFVPHILHPFFKFPDPKKISGRPDKLK